ncbi:MAG: C-type lectin domain-containing protein, partial [Candidatus Hinthialibacter sp.]
FYPFYWTGLIYENNAWIWINGDPVTYTHWIYGEPSYDGNYVEETGYGWNDRPDNLEHPCIIEFDHFPTPNNPSPDNWSTFDGDTLEENFLISGAPAGYEQGSVQISEIPSGFGVNGKGLEIKLMPGQGAFITSLQQFPDSPLVHLSGYVKASNQEGEIALIGLNSPIDGQVAYTNVRADEVPIAGYKQFHLIFAPPSGNFQYAIQAVNSRFSSLSTTIWIDNIEVEAFEPQEEAVYLPMVVDGNFEGELQDILININGDDGIVLPFFESMTDIAIRMSLQPSNTAANIGTYCLNLDDQFPLRLLGQVNIKRESLPGGGMAAMVITNGFQNLGVFRKADEIKDLNHGEDQLIIGGDFSVNNPNIPVSAFVQIGGPDAEVSVIVDDLFVTKQAIE